MVRPVGITLLDRDGFAIDVTSSVKRLRKSVAASEVVAAGRSRVPKNNITTRGIFVCVCPTGSRVAAGGVAAATRAWLFASVPFFGASLGPQP